MDTCVGIVRSGRGDGRTGSGEAGQADARCGADCQQGGHRFSRQRRLHHDVHLPAPHLRRQVYSLCWAHYPLHSQGIHPSVVMEMFYLFIWKCV